MPIKPSPTSEIRRLIAALDVDDEVKREAAIARLAVIGRRAVDRLAIVYADASTRRDKRIAILRVFEASADSRGIPIARKALAEGGDLGVAAAAALRGLLNVADPDGSALALDALVTTALDGNAERRVRVAALDALQDMPEDIRARVNAALEKEPRAALIQRTSSQEDAAAVAIWHDAMDGQLPDDPTLLRRAVKTQAGSTALSSLQKLIDAARNREREAGPDARGLEWRALRGAVHQALGLRESTVAVYDLRETLAASDSPLPSTYLAALQAVGDASCLEPIAAAFSRAGSDERWRHQLTGAFDAIVKRETTSRGGKAMKRIAARWPDAAAALSKTSRTTPRRTSPGRT